MLIIDAVLCDFEVEEKGSFCFIIGQLLNAHALLVSNDFATKPNFPSRESPESTSRDKTRLLERDKSNLMLFFHFLLVPFMGKIRILIAEFNCHRWEGAD